MHFSTIVSAAALVAPTLAGYVLEDDYMRDFYGAFDFSTAPDPTHGFVKYVDQATARSMNLINASTTVPVEWGVDTTKKDPAGRASIRLTSKKTYNKGLVVLDVKHMPTGCGTWPAFWMVGPSWPSSGEIDIIEGVHEQTTNAMTLHTGAGCSIQKDTSVFSGTVSTGNCDIKAAGQDTNAGCSIGSKDTKSYGAGLNSNGGGVYATEWTSDAISVWFFPRGAVPADVLGDAPSPTAWGKPAAKFMNSGCNINQFFKNQQIVFDTTFCGDWAGVVWPTSSCASKAKTCNDYVQNNPSAFTNAKWTINALRVYQNNGQATSPSHSAAPAPSSKAPIGSVLPSAAPKPSSVAASVVPKPSSASLAGPSRLSSVVPKSSTMVSVLRPSSSHMSIPGQPSQVASAHLSASGGPHRPSHGPLTPSANPIGPKPTLTPTPLANPPAFGQPVEEASNGELILPTAAPTSVGVKALPTGGTGDAKEGKSVKIPSPSVSGKVPPPSYNGTAAMRPTGTGSRPSFKPSGARTSLSKVALPTGVPQSGAVHASHSSVKYGHGHSRHHVHSHATPVTPAASQSTKAGEVIETVIDTVYVTVDVPAQTPASGYYKARHVRANRRIMAALP